jgi:hypothetical protein
MCPACMASAALMAGGVISTGGVAALVGKLFHPNKGAKTDGLANKTQRRNDDDYDDEQGGRFESGLPG